MTSLLPFGKSSIQSLQPYPKSVLHACACIYFLISTWISLNYRQLGRFFKQNLLSVRLSGCPQYLLDKLQKVQNAAARLVCKAKKSDHIHPILETALATSNTSHSIQNFNYLLQLHLWNSPSVSVLSPSTLYSSKTITICIWHTNLCHPPCKHKNIWWKIFFLCWPICLEQFASDTPPLWFYLLF